MGDPDVDELPQAHFRHHALTGCYHAATFNHQGGNMKRASIVALVLALAGCASAVISDIATDKVNVVATGNDQQMIMGEAEKGCAIYKRTPVPISNRCPPPYCTQKGYLFACKEPG